jgi:HPt (histidine-containing phosphotransfer) domain-containing protein
VYSSDVYPHLRPEAANMSEQRWSGSVGRDGSPSEGVIRSEFATDPDLAPIVRMFVEELPERVRQLHEGWQAQRFEEVRRLSHQLKGAGGGYGFPGLSRAAGDVEAALIALSEGSARASLEETRKRFEELLNLCRRISN